ncbi:MAG: ECF-type sigma factor, partial [bacterium]
MDIFVSESVDTLIARHYDELRQLAHRYLRRERPGGTLETAGLVNEAYLRIAGLAG